MISSYKYNNSKDKIENLGAARRRFPKWIFIFGSALSIWEIDVVESGAEVRSVAHIRYTHFPEMQSKYVNS